MPHDLFTKSVPVFCVLLLQIDFLSIFKMTFPNSPFCIANYWMVPAYKDVKHDREDALMHSVVEMSSSTLIQARFLNAQS